MTAANRRSICPSPDVTDAEVCNRASARLKILLAAASLALAACVPAAPVQTGTSVGSVGGRIAPGAPAAFPVGISIAGAAPTAVVRPLTVESTGTGAELAFIMDILGDLQVISFRENREYCGYIGLDAQDRLRRTEFSPGVEAGCALPQIPPGMRVLASFHTHSTYSPLYASEFPTSQDLASDAQLDVDGYIATPGGRLWYHDSDTLTVRQLCGRGCLPQDPGYDPTDDGPLRASFTFDQLRSFEARGRY